MLYSTKTLADILRVFNALADRSVRYKPFHNQLAKDAFPTFMWHLFDLLLEHLVLRVLAPVPGHALRCFDDILLQDGTSFAVVDALQDTFPGRFTKMSPAAVELHATMSLFHDQAIRTGINPVVVRARLGVRERPSWGGSRLAALLTRFLAHVTERVVRDVEISTRNAAWPFDTKLRNSSGPCCMRIVSRTDSVTLCGTLQTMRNVPIPTETGEKVDWPRGYVPLASACQAPVCLRTNVCSGARPSHVRRSRPSEALGQFVEPVLDRDERGAACL